MNEPRKTPKHERSHATLDLKVKCTCQEITHTPAGVVAKVRFSSLGVGLDASAYAGEVDIDGNYKPLNIVFSSYSCEKNTEFIKLLGEGVEKLLFQVLAHGAIENFRDAVEKFVIDFCNSHNTDPSDYVEPTPAPEDTDQT